MSLMGLVSRTSGTEGNRFTNRATTTAAKMRTKSPKVVSCHRCKQFVVKSKVAIPKRRLRRQRQKRSLAYFFVLSHLATDYSVIFFFYFNLAPAPALTEAEAEAEAEAAHLTSVSRGRQYDKSN